MNESSLNDLYKNIQLAFPTTTKRQHAIDTIVIEHLSWMPFIGMRTLHVKGLAKNQGREYNPFIVFKNVLYGEGLEIVDNIGKQFKIKPLSWEKNDVLLKCGCEDFQWRMRHWNKVDKSLQGPDRKKYEALYRPGSANPKQLAGMCKHIIKLCKVLESAKVLETTIND